MHTLSRLKKSWTVAPANALLNSSFRVMCPKETKTLVTVVPMLAPMMMGIALGMVRLLPATRATTIEVVAEELWTTEVERMPATRPTKGLEVISMRVFEKSFPSSLKAPPMVSMLKKKQYNERMRMSRRMIFLCMWRGGRGCL